MAKAKGDNFVFQRQSGTCDRLSECLYGRCSKLFPVILLLVVSVRHDAWGGLWRRLLPLKMLATGDESWQAVTVLRPKSARCLQPDPWRRLVVFVLLCGDTATRHANTDSRDCRCNYLKGRGGGGNLPFPPVPLLRRTPLDRSPSYKLCTDDS